MKELFTRFLPFSMATLMLLSSIAPTFATVTENQTVNVDSNAQTEVIYNQESTFGVTIPKAIDLGVDKTTNYSVTVFGDFASDETVFVVPDDSFLMKDTNTSNSKADVEAIVDQDKTEWKFNELETIGNGNVTAENLTAGIWEGKFYFNIKLKNCNISVTATNEVGENLNASATYITGSEKDNLLNSLVDEGYVNDASEVDALINVKSDDFDGLADTIFDVSDVYEEGDEIVILHFNEETSEWEYIGQETVDANGLISGDFTSYSPVAFVKVTENGEYIPTELEPGLYDAEGNMICTWSYFNQYVSMAGYSSGSTGAGSTYNTIKKYFPNVTKIIFDDNVGYIGDWAFYGCNFLTEVILPESLWYIGEGAFKGCTGLTEIVIPKNVTRIGCYALSDTSIASIKFEDTTTWYKKTSLTADYEGLLNITDDPIQNAQLLDWIVKKYYWIKK